MDRDRSMGMADRAIAAALGLHGWMRGLSDYACGCPTYEANEDSDTKVTGFEIVKIIYKQP
jgi:hypothetical protein